MTTTVGAGFAEKLFTKLRSTKTDRFEIRLMYMNLISRLIGIHEVVGRSPAWRFPSCADSGWGCHS
jgi:hypothetical protein